MIVICEAYPPSLLEITRLLYGRLATKPQSSFFHFTPPLFRIGILFLQERCYYIDKTSPHPILSAIRGLVSINPTHATSFHGMNRVLPFTTYPQSITTPSALSSTTADVQPSRSRA